MAPKLRAFHKATLEGRSLHATLPSKLRKEPWSQMVLEFNPCQPTCWEDRPWSHSLEFGVHCAKSLLYGTHHMEPRIHHSLWQAAWPGNHPEGYILIRKLAAVFQSHYWNFTFYFIFSKPACPSFFFQPVFSFPWRSGLSQ